MKYEPKDTGYFRKLTYQEMKKVEPIEFNIILIERERDRMRELDGVLDSLDKMFARRDNIIDHMNGLLGSIPEGRNKCIHDLDINQRAINRLYKYYLSLK
jgi:hypothetical protein